MQNTEDQYAWIPTEAGKITFAVARKGGNVVPGREIYRNFITELWRTSRMHNRIVKVLSAEGLHPITLAMIPEKGWVHDANDKGLGLPKSSSYVPLAVDPVARALFGYEALDRSGRLPEAFRGPVQTLIQRTWTNIRNQTKRNLDKIGGVEEAARKAFEDLLEGAPTKPQIRAVIHKVSKWQLLAQNLQMTENIAKVAEILDELYSIMSGLEGKGSATQLDPEGLAGANATARQILATEEDVSDLVNLYRTYFDTNEPGDYLPLDDQHLSIAARLVAPDGTDLGVESESLMTPQELAASLCFDMGLPFLLLFIFNKYRHCDGYSNWDKKFEHLFEEKDGKINKDLVPISLHWHQLCGVQAIIRMNFSPQASKRVCPGVLIADDVGLGKTFQAAALIAFLCKPMTRHDLAPTLESPATNMYLPPIINLISMEILNFPMALIEQWYNELRIVFKPRRVDILKYEVAKSKKSDIGDFWAASGPFYKSKQKASGKIILVSHSALLKDFARLYLSFGTIPRDTMPWTHPNKRHNYDTNVKKTLYGQQYLTVTIDKAQAFRNVGMKHSSALVILESAMLRIIMTATPLQTSMKDLAAMGRLIGIPHFLSEDALHEERADMTAIQKAKGFEVDDGEGEELRQVQSEIVLRMQKKFQGRIISRKSSSKDSKGEALITLPRYDDVLLVVNPTAREMEIITEHANNTKESAALFPAIPPHEDGKQKTDKILIYQEFPSLTPLLRNILKLYGVESLSIDGQMSFQERTKVVWQFCKGVKCRVLIISSVGTTGLNLTIANIIIFLVQPWSAQDERQIHGRALRQGQKKRVVCYHPLANGTADIVLSALAREKHELLEAFLEKQDGRDMLDLMSGKMITYASDDFEPGDLEYTPEEPGRGKLLTANVDQPAEKVSKVKKAKVTRAKSSQTAVANAVVGQVVEAPVSLEVTMNMSEEPCMKDGTNGAKQKGKKKRSAEIGGGERVEIDAPDSATEKVAKKKEKKKSAEMRAGKGVEIDAPDSATQKVAKKKEKKKSAEMRAGKGVEIDAPDSATQKVAKKKEKKKKSTEMRAGKGVEIDTLDSATAEVAKKKEKKKRSAEMRAGDVLNEHNE
ncbi:hypothetical protein H0H81_002857 [Sphagnurus paluster]|uniref:Helicase C-terminal domain-containing protein n=1 Tax=Sphagnurus paluster TaxID=117069 RepID=A0A9P7K2G5_9AGAR|nr:hypothetical protein H0H81_002857 [Sphagnurus paluster]